jgi:hypothetical protein
MKNCSSICTNDVSDFNSRFCDGNAVFTDSTSELCKWEEGANNSTYQTCNCEGLLIPEACSLFDVFSPSECKKLKSEQGGCFFNGDNQDSIEKVLCSDIYDIKECEDFKERALCTYAKKYTYPNLETYSSSSNTTFLCLWTLDEGCKSKELGRLSKDDEGKGKISVVVIVIIIVVITLTLISILLIMIIIVRRLNSRRNARIKEYEMHSFNLQNDTNSHVLTNSLNSLSGVIRIVYFFILCYFLFFFVWLVKRGHSNEYTIGEIVGENYEIEKIIGRGMIR